MAIGRGRVEHPFFSTGNREVSAQSVTNKQARDDPPCYWCPQAKYYCYTGSLVSPGRAIYYLQQKTQPSTSYWEAKRVFTRSHYTAAPRVLHRPPLRKNSKQNHQTKAEVLTFLRLFIAFRIPHPPMMKKSVPDSHATRNRSDAGRSPYSHANARSSNPAAGARPPETPTACMATMVGCYAPFLLQLG